MMKKMLALAFLLVPSIVAAQASRDFDSGSSEHFNLGSLPSGFTDSDYSFACVIREDFTFGTSVGMSVGDSASAVRSGISHGAAVGNNQDFFDHVDDSSSNATASSSTYSSGTTDWHLLTGSSAGTAARYMWAIDIPGTTAERFASDTTSLGAATPDRMSIGRWADSTPSNYWDGEIVYCAAWSTNVLGTGSPGKLSTRLSTGMSPTVAWPADLVGFWWLVQDSGSANAIDYSGNGNDMTVSGTISNSSSAPQPTYWPTGGN